MNIRLPCSTYITVEVNKYDTISTLKDRIPVTLFAKDHFAFYLPGQEDSLHDTLSLLSLPPVPFLQLIPNTLDVSKISYDCVRHNITPSTSFESLSIEELVRPQTSFQNLYNEPCVPSVPKATSLYTYHCDIM